VGRSLKPVEAEGTRVLAARKKTQPAAPSESGLPELTHLQFITLRLTDVPGGLVGRDLRAKLSPYHRTATNSAFWKNMERLERAGHVMGSYEPMRKGTHGPMERRYQTTKPGRAACERSRQFYADHGPEQR
jgi:hypothetical protein